jgi:transcriptional regulator with XRE-family HTH domain
MNSITLGESIRNARLNAGLTQAELANRIGTNQHTISLYENDQQDMGVHRLFEIAKALGVLPVSLFNS